VPASIKLKEEYGDDLHVLFVESQGATLDTAELFALKRKWIGHGAMWTTERPVDSPGSGLPATVLLSNEGEVLVSGNPLSLKKRIEEAIEEQLRLRDEAPEGTPKELAKAWKDFAKDEVADAIERAREVAADEPELAQAAQAAEETFLNRSRARIDRVSRMIDQASFAAAVGALEELEKTCEGCEELTAKLAEVRGRLQADGMEAEIEADRALAKALEKLAAKGKLDAHAKHLAKLAEAHAGTKAAERAQRYAAALAD
jgi:hypothetical protein